MKRQAMFGLVLAMLFAGRLGAQTCNQPFTLRQEACPGGESTCLSKGSTLSFQELDRDIMNTVDLCNSVGQFNWPEPALGVLRSSASGVVSIKQDVFNVLDYGADRVGVADSTAAFNAAKTAAEAAGGGVVYAPAGDYDVVPSALEAIDTAGVEFRGDGPSATRITALGDGDLFKFGNVAAPFAPCGGLRDLMIIGSTSRTGWAVSVDGCDQGYFENVQTDVGGNGFVWCQSGVQCNIWKVRNVRIVNYGSATVGIKLGNGNDRFISALNIRGGDADRTGKTGLLITESYGDFFTDIDIVLQEIGIHVVPVDSGGVNWINMMDVLGDTNLNYGFLLTGANPIRGFTCLSCWGSSNGRNWGGVGASTAARGFLVDNSSVASSYAFTTPRAFENGGIGFEVGAGVKNFSITGGWIQSSSAEGSGTLPGLRIGNSGSKIVGLRSGHAEGTGTGSQSYGIEITSGADNFLVTSNDVRQNVTGGILNSAGLSATKVVHGNLGSSAADSFAGYAPKFIIQTADASLPNAQATGALTTGIVKNTTTTGVLSIAVAGDFPTLNQSTTGNAATATALAANGANCSAGSFPLGVDAAGAAESCTALPTTIAGTANQITASAATGPITLSIPSSPTLPGTTTGTFSGNLTGNVTGNASTSTALAADPTDCSAGSPTIGINAIGTAQGCITLAWTDGGSTVTASGATDRIGAGGTPSVGHFYLTGTGTASADYANSDADGATLYLQDSANGVGNGGQILFGASSGIHAGIKSYLNNGTGPEGFLELQTRTTSGNVTSKVEIRGNGHVIMKQSSPPSISCTGTGSGASATAAGNDNAFRITINTGTSTSSSGACTITFAAAYSTTNSVIVCMPVSGASAWGVETALQLTTESLSAPILTWTNVSGLALTNLTASSSYKINCINMGL